MRKTRAILAAAGQALRDALGLSELPQRIECFDISHIQGAETVASMVVWEAGKMKKSDYRKFIIRSVEGVDDFASMREVVTRRYKRVLDDNAKMPSLVLIDGGLGQLHAEDRFSVIKFSTSVTPFRDKLVPANKDYLEAATKWVDGLKQQGGTAIWPARRTAIPLSVPIHIAPLESSKRQFTRPGGKSSRPL